MIDDRIIESKCLNCGVGLSAATCANDAEARPEPGCATVCLYCGHLMVFADDLTLRAPTDEEMHDLAGDPNIIKAQKLREEYRKWREKNVVE